MTLILPVSCTNIKSIKLYLFWVKVCIYSCMYDGKGWIKHTGILQIYCEVVFKIGTMMVSPDILSMLIKVLSLWYTCIQRPTIHSRSLMYPIPIFHVRQQYAWCVPQPTNILQHDTKKSLALLNDFLHVFTWRASVVSYANVWSYMYNAYLFVKPCFPS